MCQCPQTGYHHFHINIFFRKEVKEDVSMPSNGLPSFPQQLGLYWNLQRYMCQCPQTGYHHFHRKKNENYQKVDNSVNALKRATIISTEGRMDACGSVEDVSMPSNGLPSFPLYLNRNRKQKSYQVSMPSNGLPSFPQCLSETLYLQGFPTSFLHVIV